MISAVLALVIAAAPLQRPTPTPIKAAEKQQQQAGEVQGKPAYDQSATRQDATTVQQSRPRVATRNQQDSSGKDERDAATDWWSVINTMLLTVFNGALAVLAFRQWRAMQIQADVMKKQLATIHQQFEHSERPWLKISAEVVQWFRDEGTARALVLVKVQNVGKSLAQMGAAADIIAGIPSDSIEERARIVVAEIRGTPVFPGDTIERLLNVDVPKAVIDAGSANTDGSSCTCVACVATVTYRFVASEKEHVTRVAYLLAETNAFTVLGGHVTAAIAVAGPTLTKTNITAIHRYYEAD